MLGLTASAKVVCVGCDVAWNHLYNCSSPTVFRQCQMMVYPLKPECAAAQTNENESAHESGLLIVHATRVSHTNPCLCMLKPGLASGVAQIECPYTGPDVEKSLNPDWGRAIVGSDKRVFRICACCRRLQIPSGEWKWVSSLASPLVVLPPSVTDTICPSCLSFFYAGTFLLQQRTATANIL